jgi:primosomal protein N' (replication factor Y)
MSESVVTEKRYVQVAFPIPVPGVFTYLVPEELREQVVAGTQVLARLSGRRLSGFAVGFEPREDLRTVKLLEGLVRPEPVFDARTLRLAHQVADHYLCPLGEVLAAAYPAHAEKRPRPRQAPAVPPTTVLPQIQAILPNQPEVTSPVLDAIAAKENTVFVLHLGDSARERTYASLARAIVEAGGSVLFLVPEVWTSSSLVGHLKSEFREGMTLFNSKLRISERKRIWEAAREGQVKVVVGTRSAVFLPLRELRLIVVNDEHAEPFKQDETPRYNGRDVALTRARIDGIPIILASATPSVETYWALGRGEYRLLESTAFVQTDVRPSISVVDMRKVEKGSPLLSEFSPAMISAIQKATSERRKVLLFLNRRGFSTYVQCQDCGALETCGSCELPLVLHSLEKELVCHHCGHRGPAPTSCSNCGGVRFRFGGAGVEKVETQLRNFLPDARIARLDMDSARSREDAIGAASAFETGDVDILIGTLMVTKGLELGDITLVGVLHAETQLNIPDFRSGERAFQLLTEIVSLVQGPAVGGLPSGEVIVQTLNPDHHSVTALLTGDHGVFYEQELRQRQELGYPPFSVVIGVYVFGPKEAQVLKVVGQIGASAASVSEKLGGEVQILGPSPAFPPRLRGQHRWRMSIRGRERSVVAEAARTILAGFGGKHDVGGVTVSVDVDPVGT